MPNEPAAPYLRQEKNSTRSLLFLVLLSCLLVVCLSVFGNDLNTAEGSQGLEDAVYTVADTLLSVDSAAPAESDTAEHDRIASAAQRYIAAHNAFHRGEGVAEGAYRPEA